MAVTEPMTTHTPGPWVTDLREDHEGGLSISADNYRVATAHMRIKGLHDGHRQQVANARLITAAPDLLTFVNKIAHLMPTREPEQTTASVIDRAIYEARHLLAKVVE